MKNVNASESEPALAKILKQRGTVLLRYQQRPFLKVGSTTRNITTTFQEKGEKLTTATVATPALWCLLLTKSGSKLSYFNNEVMKKGKNFWNSEWLDIIIPLPDSLRGWPVSYSTKNFPQCFGLSRYTIHIVGMRVCIHTQHIIHGIYVNILTLYTQYIYIHTYIHTYWSVIFSPSSWPLHRVEFVLWLILFTILDSKPWVSNRLILFQHVLRGALSWKQPKLMLG